jgi:hypothetical protein
MHQENKMNRHKYPFANILHKYLKLSLTSFEQPQGIEFRNMLDCFIIPALESSSGICVSLCYASIPKLFVGIKVNALTMDEMRDIAKILADRIRPHLSRRHGRCRGVEYDFSVLRDKCSVIVDNFSCKMPMTSGVRIIELIELQEKTEVNVV